MVTDWFAPEWGAIWWLGIAGFLMGAGGVLGSLRPGVRFWQWLRDGAGAALCLLTVSAGVQGQPIALWITSLVLVLVWLMILVSLPRPDRPFFAWLPASIPAPLFQWSTVMLACPLAGLVLAHQAGNASFERADGSPAPASISARPVNWEHLPWKPVPTEFVTDLDHPVPLFALNADYQLVVRAQQLDADVSRFFAPTDGMIRTAPPDPRYDCHGWVFTRGQYVIKGQAVETILKENGYQAVECPQLGDLVIYRDDAGQIKHSGVVVGFAENERPLVESKWGSIGRYVSPVHTRMYFMPFTFFHSSRKGHLLRNVLREPLTRSK